MHCPPCPQPAGPRIFVGKLSKDTGEQDVKDHFMRFGFVLDVYLPRGEWLCQYLGVIFDWGREVGLTTPDAALRCPACPAPP
jgi:hypothetical protein